MQPGAPCTKPLLISTALGSVHIGVEDARLHRVRVLHLNEDAIAARRGETVREFDYRLGCFLRWRMHPCP